jgi:hypothetical protein
MEASNQINYFDLHADNPSLNELILFTRVHNDQFEDIDVTALTEYDKTPRESWSKRRYCLLFVLHAFPDTPLTCQILDDAKQLQLHVQRVIEYDAFEASSIQRTQRLYHQLIEIIERYRIVYDDIMYNPVNGIEYLLAKERFERSQEQRSM